MKNNKTRKVVLASMLAALGMVLGIIEIPYPIAPWLNFDLSEVVVLIATHVLGLGYALFVIVCKFFVSLLYKGPVGPMAIGQIGAVIASTSISVGYYYLRKIKFVKNEKFNLAIVLTITMFIFAMIMFITNYYFITPTYLNGVFTWYSDLPFAFDINGFNEAYGSNLTVPSWLSFLSPYGQAIFFIYFPFNFLKGLLSAGVYMIVKRVEKVIKV